MNYVVYSHNITLDGKSRPFYVGKGMLPRANNLRRNRYHANVVKKYGVENVSVQIWLNNLTEQESLDCEVELISFLKSEGVRLTNLTDGGEGVTGLKFSDDSKRRLSKIQSELNNIPARKQAFAEQMLGNKYALGYRHTEETLEKLRVSNSGRTHLESSKKAIGDAQRGELNHRWGKPSHNRGKPQTDDTKALLSTANTGKFCITDGVVNKVFSGGTDVTNFLQNGWRLGMTKKIKPLGRPKKVKL